MIEASSFVSAAGERGFRLYTGVPCSFLTPFINFVIDSDDTHYVAAANEGDAVAIAAGAELGGMRTIVMFQNSGLGNAVSPLTSLTYVFRIPVLIITTYRGEPGGPHDEPQHELMGAITTDMLEAMRIPWEYLPTEDAAIAATLDRAVAYMDEERRPYALVMRKGTVKPSALHAVPVAKPVCPVSVAAAEAVSTRQDMLRRIQALAGSDDLIVATTGYTGRELFSCADRPNQLYMVGSMGCASSIGLGLALARPERTVIVIDGDGAALMRLGAMSTIGFERPPNLVHIVLDNQVYESTGSQSTVSGSVDFCGLAAACGYPRVSRVTRPDELAQAILDSPGQLAFYHVPILPGAPRELGRPDITPPDVAARFRQFLQSKL